MLPRRIRPNCRSAELLYADGSHSIPIVFRRWTPPARMGPIRRHVGEIRRLFSVVVQVPSATEWSHKLPMALLQCALPARGMIIRKSWW